RTASARSTRGDRLPRRGLRGGHQRRVPQRVPGGRQPLVRDGRLGHRRQVHPEPRPRLGIRLVDHLQPGPEADGEALLQFPVGLRPLLGRGGPPARPPAPQNPLLSSPPPPHPPPPPPPPPAL